MNYDSFISVTFSLFNVIDILCHLCLRAWNSYTDSSVALYVTTDIECHVLQVTSFVNDCLN